MLIFKVKATFAGDDGFCGFRVNHEYILNVIELKTATRAAGGPDMHAMEVSLEDGTHKCPYASMQAFLQSWQDVSILSAY